MNDVRTCRNGKGPSLYPTRCGHPKFVGGCHVRCFFTTNGGVTRNVDAGRDGRQSQGRMTWNLGHWRRGPLLLRMTRGSVLAHGERIAGTFTEAQQLARALLATLGAVS